MIIAGDGHAVFLKIIELWGLIKGKGMTNWHFVFIYARS